MIRQQTKVWFNGAKEGAACGKIIVQKDRGTYKAGFAAISRDEKNVPIGTKVPDDKKVPFQECELILNFDSKESIDVVINKLLELRDS